MNKLQAQRLADRLNREEADKIRWSYVPRHSAIEGAWYVAKLDCLDGERLVERIYK